MKFLIMCIAAVFWGYVAGQLFGSPTSLIVAIIGGGLIGYFWNNIWDFVTIRLKK